MEKDETIKGTVTTVARTGGIKLNDSAEWFNPHGRAKEFIKPEIKGKVVELTMTGKDNDFRFIKVVSEGLNKNSNHLSSSSSVSSKEGYWQERAANDKENQKRLMRQWAYRTATESMGILPASVSKEEIRDYYKQAVLRADLALHYVKGTHKIITDKKPEPKPEPVQEEAVVELDTLED